jgi:sec-independent protein translocase protein TatB
MFDIGWQELFIIAVLVVIVVGPKDLPRTLRAIMGWVR